MPRITRYRHIAAVTLAVLCAAKPHVACANDITWTGLTSAAFSNAGNWSPAIPDVGDSLNFKNAGPSGAVLTNDYNLSVQSVTFSGPTGFTINQTGSFTLRANGTVSNLSTAGQIWNGTVTLAGGNNLFNLAGNLTIAGSLLPASIPTGATVTLTGPGTLNLSGNAYVLSEGIHFSVAGGNLLLNESPVSGYACNGFDLSAGTVTLAGTGSSEVSGTVTIGGGTWDLDGQNGSLVLLQGTGGTITNSFAGSTSTLTLSPSYYNGYNSFTGRICDGGGAVSLYTYSTLVLSNPLNNFSGGITLRGSGSFSAALVLDNAAAMGTGPLNVVYMGAVVAHSDLVINNNVNLAGGTLGVFGPGAVTFQQSLQGAGGCIVYAGVSTLTFISSNAITGTYTINSGAMVLPAGVGQMNASGMFMQGDGKLILDNAGGTGSSTDRAVNLNLGQGGGLVIKGSALVDTVDRIVGPISVSGDSSLTVNPAGHSSGLNGTQLSRIGPALVHFYSSTGIVGVDALFAFNTAPSLVGNGSAGSASNAAIIPWALVNDTGFATYGANGIAVAASTSSVSDAEVTPGINFNGHAEGLVIDHATSVNSFFHAGSAGTLTLSDTLTLSSGALAISHDLTITGTGVLNCGAEAILINANSQLNLEVPLAATSVTFGGSGSANTILGPSEVLNGNVAIGNVTLTINNSAALQSAAVTLIGGSPSRISFGDTTSASLGTLAGGGSVALINSSGSAVGLMVGAGNVSTTFSGSLSGPGTLTKTGSGTLTLSGTSILPGGVTILHGTLVATNTGAIGTGTVTLAGGTLVATGNGSDFSAVYPNPIVVSGSSGLGSDGVNHTRAILSGPLSGDGTLTLNGINNSGFPGNFVYLAGDMSNFTGTIRFDINASSSAYWLGPGTTQLVTSTFDLSHAKVVLSGQSKYQPSGIEGRLGSADRVSGTIRIGELSGTGGVLEGGYSSGTATIFEVGALNTDSTFSGNIADQTDGPAGLTKVGTGTLTLSGTSNLFTGPTSVNKGAPRLAGSGSVNAGIGAITINAPGIFRNDAPTGSVGALTGAGTLALDSGTLSVGTKSVSTFTGTIVGPGNLTKVSTGTLTLAGTDTFTGTTTVKAGVLTLAGSLALGASTVQISGGTLSFTSPAATLGGLQGTGNLSIQAITLSVGANGATTTFSGSLTGSGAITKIGDGTLVLHNTNSYSGGTSLNGGIISLAVGANPIPSSGIVTFQGGALQFTSLNTTDYSARFSHAAGQAYAFDTNAQNLTFATALFSPGGSLAKLGPGTLTLNGTDSYSGPTSIAAGSLIFSGSVSHNIGPISSAGNMFINAGATLNSDAVFLSPSGSLTINGTHILRSSASGGAYATRIAHNDAAPLSGTSEVSALTLGTAGTLDLRNNALILQPTTANKATLLAQVASSITTAHITSSTAASNSAYAVVVADNADLGSAFFGGLPVDNNSILITQALLGDANLDGFVDFTDFNIWLGHNGNSNSYSTAAGDLNNDGFVDFTDFNIWLAHNGNSTTATGIPSSTPADLTLGTGEFINAPAHSSSSSPTPVPEPATAALLLSLTLLLLKRRHPRLSTGLRRRPPL